MMPQDWTEKYRPASLNEVAGNPKALGELKRWAKQWEEGIPKRRAVILAGSPGIGKTTCAYALAKDMGWGIIELNASDQRNFEAVTKVATAGALNQTFSDDGSYLSTTEGGRKLILLDEADNLFGNEDKGGIQAIVKTISATRQPIILVVNDLYGLTRRSSVIVHICTTIKFMKITKPSIISTLNKIAQKEGINVPDAVLSGIAVHVAGDLRAAIRDLQSLAIGRDDLMIEDLGSLGYRDPHDSIFSALYTIFGTRDFEKALSATRNLDEDPKILALWVDENLPLAYRNPIDLERGFNALSRADVFLGRVYKRQHYRMWAYAKPMMTAGVALAKAKEITSHGRYQFPNWLRKMKSSKPARNVRKSLVRKLGRHCHCSDSEVRSSFLPYFEFLYRSDHEYRLHTSFRMDLEPKEIAFLLDVKDTSKGVKDLIKEVKLMQDEFATPGEALFAGYGSDPSKTNKENEKENGKGKENEKEKGKKKKDHKSDKSNKLVVKKNTDAKDDPYTTSIDDATQDAEDVADLDDELEEDDAPSQAKLFDF